MREGNSRSEELERKARFQIVNKLGLHARAAAVLVQLANKFDSDIEICKDGLQVSGKSIMSVLQLAALKGDSIEIIARGGDSRQALEAIGDLIANRFGEEE
ncbi:MAG: HPr family phosphocarrier protein [Deltaproteobacteria bacterium]|nr:MAG: HPr family phosphocarrier protein [Deltaproteobacteria bacterium]